MKKKTKVNIIPCPHCEGRGNIYVHKIEGTTTEVCPFCEGWGSFERVDDTWKVFKTKESK